METGKPKKRLNLKNSISVRLIVIGILTLLLLIPLEFIKNLIYERMSRQEEVVEEISKKWGKEVLLYGPILKIPYKEYKVVYKYDNKTKSNITEKQNSGHSYAYFFPEQLNIKSTINPEEKKRGIYKTAVYKSLININGTFSTPDFSEKEILEEDILWDKAKIIVQTSNLKGVNNLIEIKINNNDYPLKTTLDNEKDDNHYNRIELHNLESKHIKKDDLPTKNAIHFSLSMNINGSEQIRFIPVGKETEVNIKSNWKTANFLGEFLPYNSDKITTNGFDAKWKVLDINRPFAQQTFGIIPNLKNYAFGVNFKIPVDEYQKSERSAKYGILVIALTFIIFFLIQTMSKIMIHPFQYLMIGIALSMFYTLLISISEHSSYLIAYLIAGIAVVLLITAYSKTILKNIKFPMLIGSSLTVLYTFIFVIIQLESYALLVGSIGLFIILAIVMFASRKIDWQNG